MNRLLAYTLNKVVDILRPKNLENDKMGSSRIESEEHMPLNKKKIRREVLLNGEKVWVTADSEQEYVDKLLRLSGIRNVPTGEKHNFRDYAMKWFNVFAKPNVEVVTWMAYERQLTNHIFPVLGDMNVEDVTPTDVQQVFNNMGEHTKQETKNKTKTVLNQIFKMAVDDNLLIKNPLLSSTIRIKGTTATITEPYTVDQMRYLASHLIDIRNPFDRAWLAISISLPLRPEEVLGLKWRDIDKESCVVHVQNTVTHPTRNAAEFKPYAKTASSIRDLAFPKEMLGYLPERGDPDEFVIGGIKAISYTALRNMRKRIAADTRFNELITPRRFRTTVATDISAMTHDLKLVQKSLGHSTPQMTLKHYDKGRSTAIDASNAIGTCYGLTSN